MRTKASQGRRGAGFSLVELLVTITVIGVVSMIAIPNFMGLSESARDAKDLRNAQMIVNVASSALAAGYPAENFATKEDVLDRLKEGISIRNGNVEVKFSISEMDDMDIQSAGNYVEVANGFVSLVIEGTKEAAVNPTADPSVEPLGDPPSQNLLVGPMQ